MAGIRICNIPPTLGVQVLQACFEPLVDSRIDKIYYPLLNNDAVITFQDKHAVAKILSRKEITSRNIRFDVKPLPHQIFESSTVLLEDHVASLVLATSEYKDTLEQNGIKIISMKSNQLAFKGNWFEVEWAWNYLHGILDRQYHIQDNLVQHQRSASNATMNLVNGMTELGNRPLARRPTTYPGLTNEVHVSVSGRSRTSVADQLVENRRRSPNNETQSPRITSPSIRSGTNSPHESTVSRSPTGTLGAVGGIGEDVISRRNNTHKSEKASETSFRKETYYSGPVTHNNTDILSNTHGRSDDEDDSLPTPRTSVAGGLSLSSKERDNETQDTRNGVAALRFSRSQDADHTFERFASITSHNGTEGYQETGDTVGSDSKFSDSAHKLASIRTSLTDLPIGDTSSRYRLTLSAETEVSEHASALRKSNTGKALQHSTSITEYDIPLPNGVKVSVYFESITKAKVECIVNAANCDLINISGVARAIEKAAGPLMKKECEDYVKLHGSLPPGGVMQTKTVGKLSHLRCIIHTVGPIYSKENPDISVQLLTRTFYNCLIYTNEKTVVKSLAFPFISTGLFGVPLECCVEAFLDALVLFTYEKGKPFFLNEIHLVNNDADSVCMAIVMFKQHLEKSFESLVKEAQCKKESLSNSRLLQVLELGSDRKSREDRKYSSARHRSSSLSRMDKVGSIDYRHTIHDVSLSGKQTIPSSKSDKDPTKVTGTSSAFQQTRPRSGSLDVRNWPEGTKTTHTNSHSRPSSISGAARPKHSTAPNIGGYGFSKVFQADKKLKTMTSASSSQSPRSQNKPMKVKYEPKEAFVDDHIHGGDSRAQRASELSRQTMPYHARSEEQFSSLPTTLPSRHAHEGCPICLEPIADPKILKECGHVFCRHCIDNAFVHKPVCPQCGKLYGELKGDQPRTGRMSSEIRRDIRIPGYESAMGAIEITYDFPSGMQEAHHPHPGRRYSGIFRQAYLPNNEEGRVVLALLQRAFEAGLVFTIGESRTTGAEDVLTWNDIHHKTKVHSADFGYPDPGYLKRVKEELAAKGIEFKEDRKEKRNLKQHVT